MRRLILCLTCIIIGQSTAFAQFTHSSATAALQGFNPAAVQGTDALFLNPAALQQVPGFKLALVQIDTRAGGSLLRFDLYNEYLRSNQTLSTGEVDALLGAWFGNETAVRTAGAINQITLFALAYATPRQAFGLALRMRQHHRMRMNRGLLDVLLKGTGEDRRVPLNGSLQAISFAEITFGYAHRFMNDKLRIGIAPKLLLGGQAIDATLTSTATFSDGAIEHTFDYQMRASGAINDLLEGFDLFANPEPNERALDTFGRQLAGLGVNGKGFGINLGLHYRLSKQAEIGISFTDVGVINWSAQSKTYTPVQHRFVFNGINLQLQRLREEYEGDLGAYMADQLDSLARAAYEDVTITEEAFRSPLPAAFHIGTAYRAGKQTAIGAALSVGLNDAAGNLSRKPIVTVGGRTRLLVFPLFGGIRAGGDGALILYGGSGLRIGNFSWLISLSGTPKSALMGTGSRFSLMVSLVGVGI